jgi:glucosyl-3-phosphoglycerate synthase
MALSELPPPAQGLRASVVVPARDEEELIGGCLRALAAQIEIDPAEYEVIVVLDGCSDSTATVVEQAGKQNSRLRLLAVPGPGRGSGPARAVGMDLACARLEAVGNPDGLIASTDADSEVAGDWLARQLEALSAGAQVVGGEVVLEPGSARLLSDGVADERADRLAERLRDAKRRGPSDHPHFAGASIGLTPNVYRQVGGLASLAALEDADLERRLAEAEIAIHRLGDVRVTTSARRDGRAARGLSADLALADWIATRSVDGASFGADRLLAAKDATVAVLLPAREVAETIGPILDRILPLRDLGLLDRVIVVDADSADGTAAVAARRGAEVWSEAELSSQLGPCLGKGDAMWRAAAECDAEVLMFLDADTADFHDRFVLGMLGPILLEPEVQLVKGAFRRPFRANGTFAEDQGGRVTELVARPLLNLHFPALCGFVQPLAGETAITRDLFKRLSVPVGYGVEIAMLIDALKEVGLGALAQADLGSRQNRHQQLRELSAMAMEVMLAVEARCDTHPAIAFETFIPQPRLGAPLERWHVRSSERPPISRLAPVEAYSSE